jgi:hypothetical protein
MKIFQAYYREEQRAKCLPGLVHIDTSSIAGDLLEYDIFKALRHEGDFGVISWRFRQKTQLTKWQDRVHEQLKLHDAVIINPFPGLDAISWNCWDSHPGLMPYAQVDTTVFQRDIAFCSYIFAKRRWWDRYFTFMDERLRGLDTRALALGESSRDKKISHVPFLIERWLNYTLDGAWLWQYPREHYEKKFGSAELWELKQSKGTREWEERRRHVSMEDVALMEYGKRPKRLA